VSGADRYVFLGLSITSSWGNGHATTYRALVRELAARGHDVLFLERDLPFYADNRDEPRPPGARTELYRSVDELVERFGADVREADVVVLGSFVPDGVAVADWVLRAARGVRAFYDIDTPVTLRRLASGGAEYLAPWQVGRFDLYLSFTAGPTLAELERRWGARRAVALHCGVDPSAYTPLPTTTRYDLGYLGTFADDRQRALDELLLEPARRVPALRCVVAGAQYPRELAFPPNVARVEHVPPGEHRAFYGAQRLTVNVTRGDMVRAGHSPSVRMFEAAACGTPIVSDRWPGLDALFAPGREIFVADRAEDVLALLARPDDELATIGLRARARVLAEHTAAHRAETLERAVREARDASAGGAR
jgi:spore maturation protein CgeB